MISKFTVFKNKIKQYIKQQYKPEGNKSHVWSLSHCLLCPKTPHLNLGIISEKYKLSQVEKNQQSVLISNFGHT